MKIKDLFKEPFDGWDYEFYDYKGEWFASTYEKEPGDIEDFLYKFGNAEVIGLAPAEVLEFMGVLTDIGQEEINRLRI